MKPLPALSVQTDTISLEPPACHVLTVVSPVVVPLSATLQPMDIIFNIVVMELRQEKSGLVAVPVIPVKETVIIVFHASKDTHSTVLNVLLTLAAKPIWLLGAVQEVMLSF